MEPIKLSELLEAVNGTLLGACREEEIEITRVDTDSRNIHALTATHTSMPRWKGARPAVLPPGSGRAIWTASFISRSAAPKKRCVIWQSGIKTASRSLTWP